METKIIEADQDGVFYGKFLVGRLKEEWNRPALMGGSHSLLRQEGWGPEHLLILDLSRPGNGSIFSVRKDGYPTADLTSKGLRPLFCPLMEPFLEWLYAQDLSDLQALPNTVELEGMLARADRLRLQQEEWDKVKDALDQVALMVKEDPQWRSAKRRPDFE